MTFDPADSTSAPDLEAEIVPGVRAAGFALGETYDSIARPLRRGHQIHHRLQSFAGARARSDHRAHFRTQLVASIVVA